MPELDAEHRDQMAAVLAEHEVDMGKTRPLRDEPGPGNYILVCNCGAEFRPHRKRAHQLAHIADALAPLVAGWLADAWDAGWDSRHESYWSGDANPYRGGDDG